MSKKTMGRRWYQVHKSKAGDASVANSAAVNEARECVRELEAEAEQLRTKVSNTLGSSLRKLVFGRNYQEERLYQVLRKLEEARVAALIVESEARRAGEKSYRDDWARRNPDKVVSRQERP